MEAEAPAYQQQQAPAPAAVNEEGSDMEEDDEWCRPWQRFPAPHPLDVEE